jgi:RNA-directed DNA polymerase
MMHEREKSDPAIGAGKPTNKADATSVADAAEPVEQRAGTEGNASEQITHRTQSRERVSQALDRVRQAARLRKEEKFTALFHHLSIDLFRESFFALKRDAAPGVDGLTWRTYEADLDLNLTDLFSRVQRGAYRALPSRRTYIPKADGKQRPLAVAALEDKIVGAASKAADLGGERPLPSIARFRTASISDARGGNEPRSARM